MISTYNPFKKSEHKLLESVTNQVKERLKQNFGKWFIILTKMI